MLLHLIDSDRSPHAVRVGGPARAKGSWHGCFLRLVAAVLRYVNMSWRVARCDAFLEHLLRLLPHGLVVRRLGCMLPVGEGRVRVELCLALKRPRPPDDDAMQTLLAERQPEGTPTALHDTER